MSHSPNLQQFHEEQVKSLTPHQDLPSSSESSSSFYHGNLKPHNHILPIPPAKEPTLTKTKHRRSRSDRERALSRIPIPTLIALFIKEESKCQESRELLHTFATELENARTRIRQVQADYGWAEKQRKELEGRHMRQALEVTQSVLDAQREALKYKEELGVSVLRLQNSERKLYVRTLPVKGEVGHLTIVQL